MFPAKNVKYVQCRKPICRLLINRVTQHVRNSRRLYPQPAVPKNGTKKKHISLIFVSFHISKKRKHTLTWICAWGLPLFVQFYSIFILSTVVAVFSFSRLFFCARCVKGIWWKDEEKENSHLHAGIFLPGGARARALHRLEPLGSGQTINIPKCIFLVIRAREN